MRKTDAEPGRKAIVIRWNNTSCKEPRARFDGWADPPIGPALVVSNSFDFLCEECGEKYAPELCVVLALFWAASRTPAYVREMDARVLVHPDIAQC